jgi:hypothetical protein
MGTTNGAAVTKAFGFTMRTRKEELGDSFEFEAR